MIGFLKGLVSADKIVDAGIKAADAIVFTPEERAAFLLEYAKATAPMARARRWIALIVTLEWFICVNICLGLLLFESDQFLTVAEFVAKNVGLQFSVVMGFYFLAQVVDRGKR